MWNLFRGLYFKLLAGQRKVKVLELMEILAWNLHRLP
jgi:hypothetical protein